MLPVAIVEDRAEIREGIVYLLVSSEQLEVVGEYESAEDFLNVLEGNPKKVQPKVVLMDLQLPGMNGIQATRRIKELVPEIEVMILTIFEKEDQILESIRAGASGYILKDSGKENLIQEILELAQGGSPMTPRIARKLLSEIQHDFDKNQDKLEQRNSYHLSVRENEILSQIVSGYTYQEIAQNILIKPNTVRKHIQNIYQKLQVRSKAEVVSKAIQENLVDLS